MQKFLLDVAHADDRVASSRAGATVALPGDLVVA
jgi:hypothetical protein